jgi:2-aminoethylphosphonate transport system ATP-binding protein
VLPVTIEAIDREHGQAKVCCNGTDLIASESACCVPGGSALLCIRPHDFKLERSPNSGNAITGIVEAVQWQGQSHSIALTSNGIPVRALMAPMRQPPQIGEPLTLYFAAEDAVVMSEDNAAHA